MSDSVSTGAPSQSYSDPSPWAHRALSLLVVVVATFSGQVAPALQSIASQGTVEATERVAAVASYFVSILLVAEGARGASLLLGSDEPIVARVGVALPAFAALLLVFLASLVGALPAVVSVPMALLSSASLGLSGLVGLRRAHTRLVGTLALLVVLASVLRVSAWFLAEFSLSRISPGAFVLARASAISASVLELVVLLLVSIWVALRGRVLGTALVVVAIGLALGLIGAGTLGGEDSGTAFVVLGRIIALAIQGEPTSMAPLVQAASALSFTLAIALVFSRRIPATWMLVALLLLLSRGRLDVPMRALLACVAAQWLALGRSDDRLRDGPTGIT